METKTDWNARQYMLFEKERTRPVKDLLAAVPMEQVRVAIDIGCGPGNSTEVLRALAPAATISGIDSSPDMIDAARKRLPEVRFAVADIATWGDKGPYDLILANAVFQWIPDHDTLLPKLVGKLASAGTLAFQVPDNLEEPTHRLMREIAAAGPWVAKLEDAGRAIRHTAQWYYTLLKPHCARVDAWRTIYYHPLAGGADAVVEWLKGTGLRPFLAPLDQAEQAAFLARYRDAIAQAYPTLDDGSVLLPFPRLFVVATRA